MRGTPATDTYKLLLAHHAGWAGEVRVAFSWPDAYEKAKATAAILAKRVEMAGLEVREWRIEYWGVDALGGPTVPRKPDGRRCTSRPSACCGSRGAATTNAPRAWSGRELIPLTLSAPPAGLTGAGGGGRGGATELLGIWPTLIDKDARRRRSARHDRGGAVMAAPRRFASSAATAPATRATSPTSRSSPTTTRPTR